MRKSIISLLLTIFCSSSFGNDRCPVDGDAQKAYSKFTSLAFEPIIEDGKLEGYLLKSPSPENQKVAVSCLKKAVDLGLWQAAYTLYGFYNLGNNKLGIPQDSKMAEYYLNKFEEGKRVSEDNT